AAPVEGGGSRGAELRTDKSQRRSALQIQRHLGSRRMEQDRGQGDAAGRVNGSLVRGDANREFRRHTRGQLPECGEPAGRRRQIPAAVGFYFQLRLLRRSEGGRAL